MREVRTFADIEIRAEADGTPSVTLQCIKPGVVDDYGSVWKADAFDESLGQRLPTLCWAHDWSEPLGPGMEAMPGRGGPKVRFNFSNFDAVPMAKRAHAQVADGTIRDCSVGFSNTQRRDPTEGERAKYPGVREVIEKATLDEVSLVLRGAVPGAKVLSVRSARMADGSTVDMEAVMQVARDIAAGKYTQAEGKVAIELLSQGTHEIGTGAGTADGDGSGEGPSPDAVLDADIDAALASVE